MTSAASLSVELFGRDVGLSTLLTQVDAKTQATANSAIRLEAQYARLAAASGNTAQASTILSTALTNNGGASASAIAGVATQLTRLESGSTAMQQFGASAASSLASIVGPAALASAAIGGVVAVAKSFADAFAFKTQLDQSTASIKVLLNGVRDAGETFAGAAKFAQTYKLTQEETTGAIQASIPVIRNSKAGIEDILGVFARLKVLKPEKTFSDAARAIGELQAGQIVSIVDQFNISRAAANKMKDEIKGGADAIQVLSNYLTTAGVGMDALAVQTQGAQGAMRDLAKAQEDLKLAQAQFAQGPGMAILQEQIRVTSGATRLLSGDFGAMGQSIQGSFQAIATSSVAARAYADALASGAGPAAALAAANQAAAQSANDFAGAARNGGGGSFEFAGANQAATQTAAQLAAATQQLSELTGQAATESNAAASAAQQKADADAIAAINAQTHGVAEQILAAAAQSTAQRLLANGAAGAQEAALLAGSSSQLDQRAAAEYRLAAAILARRNADNAASVSATVAQQRAAGTGGRGASSDAAEGAAAAKARADAITDAQNRQTLAVGSTQQKVALLRQEYDAAVRAHGADSAAAIDAQTKLDQAIVSGTKAAKAGGATKLSDQTKLNNSLLTQQQDYQTKSEDLARTYAADVEKINKDFAAVTLAQQQADEISKRASQADFYDRLTSSDLNKKKTGSDALKKIDADYQAAFQKSQELAQAGQPKLAADYLALKQKQADSDLSFQEKIAAAKDKKDKGEISRLEAIQAMRKAVQAEEEKQLLAAGDPNVNARDKALQDAQQKEIDGQAKIGTASDRATARKIENATLAGKKIDEEMTKVNALTDAYTRTGSRAAAAGVAPSSTPPATTTPATTAPQAPGGTSDIASALASLGDKIGAVESAVKSSGKGIESAVGHIHLSAPGVA